MLSISLCIRRFVRLLFALVVFTYVFNLVLPATSSHAAPSLPIIPGLTALNKTSGKLSSYLLALSQLPALSPDQLRTLVPDSNNVVNIDASGAAMVYIRLADATPAAVNALRQYGVAVVDSQAGYGVVTGWITAGQLAALAANANVLNVSEVLAPVALEHAAPREARAAQTSSAAAQCGTTITSEGDSRLQAQVARSTYNVDGSGVTVGVLSDSFNVNGSTATTAQQDIASANLPGNGNPCGFTSAVNVLAESKTSTSTDEGRAMLQIVHDLAPGANLAFASANAGIFAFAESIRTLHSQTKADVLVDDVTYLQEPFFQDGPVSQAIQEVTNAGAIYVTAAGNSRVADSAGNDISSYETAAYRSTACPTLNDAGGITASYARDCHNFAPNGNSNSSSMVLAAGGSFTLDMQWAEPWYGVVTDLDLYLVDSNTTVLARSNTTNTGVNGSQMPFEAITYKNTTGAAQTVRLVVARASGTATPRLKYQFVRGAGIASTQFNAANNTADMFGPSIFGHNGAANALSVAAVPYNNPVRPEPFSATGPFTLRFGPVADATPAQPLAAPVTRAKPDVAATDGVQTTFFASLVNNTYRFYGTSAAAPHVAAIAALLKQYANQHAIPFDQAAAARVIMNSASPVTYGSVQTTGAGLINAAAAFQALGAKVPATPTTPTAPITPAQAPSTTQMIYKTFLPMQMR